MNESGGTSRNKAGTRSAGSRRNMQSYVIPYSRFSKGEPLTAPGSHQVLGPHHGRDQCQRGVPWTVQKIPCRPSHSQENHMTNSTHGYTMKKRHQKKDWQEKESTYEVTKANKIWHADIHCQACCCRCLWLAWWWMMEWGPTQTPRTRYARTKRFYPTTLTIPTEEISIKKIKKIRENFFKFYLHSPVTLKTGQRLSKHMNTKSSHKVWSLSDENLPRKYKSFFTTFLTSLWLWKQVKVMKLVRSSRRSSADVILIQHLKDLALIAIKKTEASWTSQHLSLDCLASFSKWAPKPRRKEKTSVTHIPGPLAHGGNHW